MDATCVVAMLAAFAKLGAGMPVNEAEMKLATTASSPPPQALSIDTAPNAPVNGNSGAVENICNRRRRDASGVVVADWVSVRFMGCSVKSESMPVAWRRLAGHGSSTTAVCQHAHARNAT